MIQIFVVLTVLVAFACHWSRQARRAQEQEEARRMQEWREQTIANGILRAEAIKGQLLASALTQQAQAEQQRQLEVEQTHIEASRDLSRLLDRPINPNR